jgi:hypothetical protein
MLIWKGWRLKYLSKRKTLNNIFFKSRSKSRQAKKQEEWGWVGLVALLTPMLKLTKSTKLKK